MPRTPNATVPVALLSLLLVLGQSAPLAACDIPVCEYALRYWSRSDYTVYYIHDGAEAPVDAEVNALLRRIAEGKDGRANLRFVSVNATLGPASLSAEARYVLESNRETDKPRHLLVSPKGRTVFSGRLAVKDIRALVSSPKTAIFADMLSRGAHGVVLLLTDSDEAQNAAARETAREVVDATRGTEARMGLVEVSRQDVRELWLVRQLLAVETDLVGIHGPMVFGVYGRCHVTEPYLGKGINATNLAALAKFMNGPCTCDIKDANLGVDLISDWAWEAQASGPGGPPRPTEPGGYVTFGE